MKILKKSESMVRAGWRYKIYYQTTICYRQWNNIKWSPLAHVISDVPQWSVLGHLLLLIHIYDINYKIMDSTVSLFAYETWIILGIKDEEDNQTQPRRYKMIYINRISGQILTIWSSIPTSSNFCDMKTIATTNKSNDNTNIDMTKNNSEIQTYWWATQLLSAFVLKT